MSVQISLADFVQNSNERTVEKRSECGKLESRECYFLPERHGRIEGRMLMVKPNRRIDAHVHYARPMTPEGLVDFMDRTGVDMANLVLVPSTQRLSCVPEALEAKFRYPDRFYVFASLDASAYYLHRRRIGAHMAGYARRMMACGCDGIKIIEGRPPMRKMMPVPDFDLPCWEPFWAYAEREAVPILWHVNDPEEYWDPDRVTDYHKALGDVYDDSFVNNEEQYAQVQRVLERHPGLKIIFAHFFFLSAQLERLGRLLDAYPNIMVDVTPGSEMYRNFSSDHDRAQAFFVKYQDRILYGTDIAARCVMPGLMTGFNEEENLRRSEFIDKLFDPRTDVLIQPDGAYLIDIEDFQMRGLDLEQAIIDKIYGGNFLRFAGAVPAKVQPGRVVRECARLRVLIGLMGLFSKQMNTDPTYVKEAQAFFKQVK